MMSRAPEAKKGQKTRTFVVKEGARIGGFDGKVKKGGDKIDLTKEQAEFYMERELVKPEMPDYDDGDDDDDDQPRANAGREYEGKTSEVKDPNREENPDEQVADDNGGNTKLNPSEGGKKSETDRAGGKAQGGSAGDGGTQAKRNARL